MAQLKISLVGRCQNSTICSNARVVFGCLSNSSRLVSALHLIGREGGTSFLVQSQRVVKQTQCNPGLFSTKLKITLFTFIIQVYGLHLNNRNDQRNAGNAPQVNAAGQNAVQAQPAGGGAAALGFQPYIRPSMFAVKVIYPLDTGTFLSEDFHLNFE